MIFCFNRVQLKALGKIVVEIWAQNICPKGKFQSTKFEPPFFFKKNLYAVLPKSIYMKYLYNYSRNKIFTILGHCRVKKVNTTFQFVKILWVAVFLQKTQFDQK